MTILSNFPKESTDLKNHLDDNTKHLSSIEKEKINTMLTPADENTLFVVPGKNDYNIVEVIDDGVTAEFFLQDNLNMGTDNIVWGIGASARGRQCVSVPGTFFNIVEANGNIITLDKSINNYSFTGEIVLCSSIQSIPPKKLTILDVDEEGYNITVATEEDIAINYDYVVLIKSLANSAADANHAEGSKTIACANTGAHAEGAQTLATGVASHAENQFTEAKGNRSHAEGFHTKASATNQHVQGRYNTEDKQGVYADIIGNGISENSRSNAYTLDWQGNGWFAGDVTVGDQNIELLKNDLSNVNQEIFATKVAEASSSSNSKDVKTCRFVIGTSTNGWTEADCDYLCDGVDDQVEIQAAIDALPESGGEIIVLDGTYNITSSIILNKSNTALFGNGSATILKRMWQESKESSMIETHYDTVKVSISNLSFDGNRNSFSSTLNRSLYFRSNQGIVNNNAFYNGGYGLYIVHCNCRVINNIFLENSRGCYTDGSSTIIINGNTFIKNISYGLEDHSYRCVISSNSFSNNETGIDASGSSGYSIIIGNCLTHNNIGICIDVTRRNNMYKKSLVFGNYIVRGNGLPSDYSENQYTLYLKDRGQAEIDQNVFAYNMLWGKNYVNESTGTNNEFIGNKFE